MRTQIAVALIALTAFTARARAQDMGDDQGEPPPDVQEEVAQPIGPAPDQAPGAIPPAPAQAAPVQVAPVQV